MLTFDYVSLFSGIGGFETALNRLGGHCVMASEIDKFARESYRAIYGAYPAGDVTKIAAKDVPDHELLVGGFPCQAFSIAGKRRGFEDTRGTLFFEAARIAKEKQPKICLFENVKGLLSHDNGRTISIMLHTLNEIGYTVDFTVLNSKFFGVPQNRERVFILALRDDLAFKGDRWKIEGAPVVQKAKKSNDDLRTFAFDWPKQECVSVRLRDILEPTVDEKYYLSKEKTAKLIAQLGEQLNKNDEGGCIQRSMSGVRKKELYGTLRAGASRTDFGVVEPRAAIDPERISKTQNGRRFKEPNACYDFYNKKFRTDGVSGTLTTNTGNGTSHSGTFGVAEPKQATVANNNNITHCLISRYEAGPRIDKKMNTVYTDGYRIRKLTPRECWRLQGFPDIYLDILDREDVSDSQKYKQAGNAVTVNVIEAIGKKIVSLLDFLEMW